MGTEVVVKSFAVVIIGGMGNVWGAAIAGLALGVISIVIALAILL
jgi:branched-subunit amino acid ABC-type transport system permease component